MLNIAEYSGSITGMNYKRPSQCELSTATIENYEMWLQMQKYKRESTARDTERKG